jgi:predicted HNH restriction endonuclease
MLRHAEWSLWTNAAIAKHVGVSAMTVGRIKATMEKKVNEPTVKKFIDKSGNQSKIDTSKLKTKQKITKPDVSTAEPEKAEVEELNEKIDELAQTVNVLADENTLMRDKIAIGQWDASEIEKIDAEQRMADLREQIRVLEADNKAIRQSRDMFQNQNSELIKTVKALQSKLKKLGQQ